MDDLDFFLSDNETGSNPKTATSGAKEINPNPRNANRETTNDHTITPTDTDEIMGESQEITDNASNKALYDEPDQEMLDEDYIPPAKAAKLNQILEKVQLLESLRNRLR